MNELNLLPAPAPLSSAWQPPRGAVTFGDNLSPVTLVERWLVVTNSGDQ